MATKDNEKKNELMVEGRNAVAEALKAEQMPISSTFRRAKRQAL